MHINKFFVTILGLVVVSFPWADVSAQAYQVESGEVPKIEFSISKKEVAVNETFSLLWKVSSVDTTTDENCSFSVKNSQGDILSSEIVGFSEKRTGFTINASDISRMGKTPAFLITCKNANGTAKKEVRLLVVGGAPLSSLDQKNLVSFSSTLSKVNGILSEKRNGFSVLSGALPLFSYPKNCVDIKDNLQRGSETQQVLELQNFLLEKGLFSERATGFFGDFTKDSVKKYQRSVGLKETGMVYEQTRQAIASETCE